MITKIDMYLNYWLNIISVYNKVKEIITRIFYIGKIKNEILTMLHLRLC